MQVLRQFGRLAEGRGLNVPMLLGGFGRLAEGLGPDVPIFPCRSCSDLDA